MKCFLCEYKWPGFLLTISCQQIIYIYINSHYHDQKQNGSGLVPIRYVVHIKPSLFTLEFTIDEIQKKKSSSLCLLDKRYALCIRCGEQENLQSSCIGIIHNSIGHIMKRKKNDASHRQPRRRWFCTYVLCWSLFDLSALARRSANKY